MAKWQFDEKKYQEDKMAFLLGVREMMDQFFGENGHIHIPSLEAFLESKGDASFKDKTPLERMLDAIPEVIREGKWDMASLPEAEQLWEGELAACLHLANSEDGVAYYALYHGQYQMDLSVDFRRALETFNARCMLDSRYPLDIAQLALLAEMDERSVRNAIRDEFGVSTSKLEEEQAREWLSRRRGFIPTKYYNSLPEELRLKNMERWGDLLHIIEWKARQLGLESAFFEKIRDGLYDTPDAESPAALLDIAESLHWNPSWFIKTAMELRIAEKILEMESMQHTAIREAMEALGLNEAFSDRPEPVNPAEYATADNIRALLSKALGLTRHQKDKGSNAKLDMYLAANGRAIAHEHNLKQQSLWIAAEGLDYRALDVRRIEQPTNRHSGLGKYPEMQRDDLIRFQPDSILQVQQILDVVTSAEPIIQSREEEGEEQ